MLTLERNETLTERLDRHPVLRNRIESLWRVIEELRQMGNEALTAWAERGVEKQTVLAQAEPDWRPGGKKTLLAHHLWSN